MGFLLGSSCLSQYTSLLLHSHIKLGRRKKKKKVLTALVSSLHNNIPSDEGICSKNRRPPLFLGVSVLPLLGLRALAADIPTNDKKGTSISEVQQTEQTQREISSPDLEQLVSKKDVELSEMKTSLQEAPRVSSRVYGTPTNSFVSMVNVMGILGSGVLCALYAALLKEKSAMESTIRSVAQIRRDVLTKARRHSCVLKPFLCAEGLSHPFEDSTSSPRRWLDSPR